MFQLPDLPYAYNALEPYIDEQTMRIHHDKHHAGYVTKLNAALEGVADMGNTIEDILTNISKLPADKQNAVRNNGGGHANHSLFWSILGPKNGAAPQGELAAAIDSAFGSFDSFKQEFSQAATTRFGSGWAWLVVQDGQLKVMSTANQDSPIMEGKTPILGLDVWEHAYYLKYQNRRPEYIENVFNIFNWTQIAKKYTEAK